MHSRAVSNLSRAKKWLHAIEANDAFVDRFGPLRRDAEVLQGLLFCQWHDALGHWQGEHPRTRGSLRSIFFAAFFSCPIWINKLCRLWFERSFPPLWTRTWLCPKAGEKLMKKPLLSLYILWHLMRCPKVMQWVSIHPSSPRTGLVGLPQCSTNRNVDFRNGIACCCNRLWRMSRRGWDETQSNRFQKV